MEKDVLVSVKGLQYMDGDEAVQEVIYPGTYYYKNGKHYVTYNETMENGRVSVSNMIKINPCGKKSEVEVIKHGGVEAHIIFEKGNGNRTRYETREGSVLMNFLVNDVKVSHSEDEIKINLGYSLEMNYEQVSDNKIEMKIISKSCMEKLKIGQD